MPVAGNYRKYIEIAEAISAASNIEEEEVVVVVVVVVAVWKFRTSYSVVIGMKYRPYDDSSHQNWNGTIWPNERRGNIVLPTDQCFGTATEGALSQSQFPVFTIYAQKSCLAVKPCERAWCIDRVQGHRLQGHTKRSTTASSRQHCLELCLARVDQKDAWALRNNACVRPSDARV
ncbi:hypothetical protein PV325_010308 [Microctonus aethiopoides]|nr:hypothetical protein PV325_010308 [Microctonus aethiopoides]